jgi:hypothetical protein
MSLSPSQMTSRASAAVGATRAMRRRPAATCARFAPIGAGVVLNGTTHNDLARAKPATRELAFGVAPRRIILHATRRIGDHQVRLDAAEHALDVRRGRAVAAEQTILPEGPQIARLRHRIGGLSRTRRRRGSVGAGSPATFHSGKPSSSRRARWPRRRRSATASNERTHQGPRQ